MINLLGNPQFQFEAARREPPVFPSLVTKLAGTR
jgi:hypothetical protein